MTTKRLSRVKLAGPFRVPGTVMEQAQVEISEDDISVDGRRPGVMKYDPETHSLVFGERGGIGINWDKVVEWEAADLELVCGWCEEAFKNAQALGGHRRACPKRPKPVSE